MFHFCSYCKIFIKYLTEDAMASILTSATPFSNVYAGGPDELFSDKSNVIEGIFDRLEEVNTGVISKAG